MYDKRYRITHPRTVTVNVDTAQSAANFLFWVRHWQDWTDYRVTDTRTGKVYAPKMCETLNGIELSEIEA